MIMMFGDFAAKIETLYLCTKLKRNQIKMIKSFEGLTSFLVEKKQRQRMIVAGLTDESTKTAVAEALRQGVISVTFVGADESIVSDPVFEGVTDFVSVKTCASSDEDAVALEAVRCINEGRGDFLMKGLIHTDNLLRAVLNKEEGLLKKGSVLAHVAVAQLRKYGKLLFFSDSAVIPEPTFEQRLAQVDYLIKTCRSFGISQPKLAMIHFTEKVNPKYSCTTDYQTIKQEAENGRWGDLVIDGPLDTRTAVDPVALSIKGIDSPVEGKADALLFPNLETANSFYKTVSYFADAQIAGMLYGTKCPIVVTSRGDDHLSKYYSILAAANLHAYSKKA